MPGIPGGLAPQRLKAVIGEAEPEALEEDGKEGAADGLSFAVGCSLPHSAVCFGFASSPSHAPSKTAAVAALASAVVPSRLRPKDPRVKR